MRYRLRTLLIVLALGPPMLALLWLHGAEIVASFQPGPARNVIWVDSALQPGWIGSGSVQEPEFQRPPAYQPLSQEEMEGVKRMADELGAPQPKPLPPGFGEIQN
jgi:hypothetical protein